MISARFQGKPFNFSFFSVTGWGIGLDYCDIEWFALETSSNAEETEVEWFYEDLQDFVELTPKKDVLFIIGDWNAKVVIPVWFYSSDCLVPRKENGHLVSPLSC